MTQPHQFLIKEPSAKIAQVLGAEGFQRTPQAVLLPDSPDDIVEFLLNVSFEATKNKAKKK